MFIVYLGADAMISSGDGYRLVSQHRTGFPSNPSVWSFGMAVPWQHPSQQLAFPVPLHFVTPQLNTQWFPLDNFASLPPKPKINQENQSTLVNTKPSHNFNNTLTKLYKTLQNLTNF